MLGRGLPDVETVSLYEVIAARGLPDGVAGSGAGRRLAVHDSCTARYQTAVQQAVRDLVTGRGYEVAELALSRERTECCGFGGLMLYADPELGDLVVDRRVGESGDDFVAYCSMCRDRFAAKGKSAPHVLDLVFGAGPGPTTAPAGGERRGLAAERRGPALSRRSERRAQLKERLLAEVWGEAPRPPPGATRLILTPEVEAVLDERFIRPEEVDEVITRARGRRRAVRGPGDRPPAGVAPHRRRHLLG